MRPVKLEVAPPRTTTAPEERMRSKAASSGSPVTTTGTYR